MNCKAINRLLLSLAFIILSPSLVLAHAGHGEHSNSLHWMDHSGELLAYFTGVAVWIVPAALICGALFWSMLKISGSVKG